MTMADVPDGQRANSQESSLLERFPRLLRRERELAVARLASTLTHTLGTPLQVIAGRAALARKTEDPEELERHLEIVQRKCSEITALLWRVLDSLRIDQEPTLEDVDVAPFLRGLLGELRAAGAARRVRWSLEVPQDGTALGSLRLRRSDLAHALLSLGLGVLVEAPDGAELGLRVEKAEEEARGLTPVHEAVLRFTFRRAVHRAAGGAEPHVAEPWLHTEGRRIDGQSIGWAAVHELVRGNEGRVEVSEEAVVLCWPAVP
jgi:signal transduction histidine kinase